MGSRASEADVGVQVRGEVVLVAHQQADVELDVL